MSKSKRLISLILALATMLVMFTGVTAFAAEEDNDDEATAVDTTQVGDFTDVTWANPYAEAIAVLAAAGITTGTNDGTTFGPKDLVTRAQVAAFVARAGLGSTQAEKLLPADTGFTDVPKDDFYSKYIAWGRSEGAINGVNWEQTLYDPEGNVTSVQILKILEGILEVDKVADLIGSMYETNTISYAIKLGLLDGVTVEDYAAPATREQIAQYILNAISAPGYANTGFGTSVNGWSLVYNEGGEQIYPLYKVHGLSRRQTENTTTTDDGTVDADKYFDPVTPYGELYYRWQYAATGKGITSWKHDDKNEQLVPTVGTGGIVIANPETTGALPLTTLAGVFKVYINGAVVNATAGGEPADGLTVTNRYTTKEYTFNASLASQAINYVCGQPNFYFQVTDETWTGATIKVYEQRLSGNGEYDLVTGKYGTGASYWGTAEFDGKADKIVVTAEYLGEVGLKSATTGAFTIDLFDAAENIVYDGRSESIKPEIGGVRGDFVIGDIVRVTPKLAQCAPYTIPGAYIDWYAYTAGAYVGVPLWNYNGYNATTDLHDQPGSAISRKFNAEFDVFKPDTKTVTPTAFGYAFAAKQSSQVGTINGRYISSTTADGLTWISGTYQEVLRANRAELYADGARYNVYLDANNYILGGFSLSGGEYAVLGYAKNNANSKNSEWDWANNKTAESRFITYYDGPSFKALTTKTATDTTYDNKVETRSEAEVYNGVLKSGVTAAADGQIVDTGTVARLWSGHAKILHGFVGDTITGSSLPTGGALYVQVDWDAYAGKFTFTPVTSSEAAVSMKRFDNRTERNKYEVYVYPDDDHTSFVKDFTVYVIDYTVTNAGIAKFVPKYLDYGTASTVAGKLLTKVYEVGEGEEDVIPAKLTVKLSSALPLNKLTRISFTTDNSYDVARAAKLGLPPVTLVTNYYQLLTGNAVDVNATVESFIGSTGTPPYDFWGIPGNFTGTGTKADPEQLALYLDTIPDVDDQLAAIQAILESLFGDLANPTMYELDDTTAGTLVWDEIEDYGNDLLNIHTTSTSALTVKAENGAQVVAAKTDSQYILDLPRELKAGDLITVTLVNVAGASPVTKGIAKIRVVTAPNGGKIAEYQTAAVLDELGKAIDAATNTAVGVTTLVAGGRDIFETIAGTATITTTDIVYTALTHTLTTDDDLILKLSIS